jgi:hypothetical protein
MNQQTRLVNEFDEISIVPVNEPRCFANRHMSMGEFALWSVCRSLAYKYGGLLYFDGQDVALMFEKTGKDKVYRLAKSLVKKGWFVRVRKRSRNPITGLWKRSEYQILSAEEWAKKHPHKCSPQHPQNRGQTIPQNANGPFPEMRMDHSLECKHPFPEMQLSIPQNATDIDTEYLEEILREEKGKPKPSLSPFPKPSSQKKTSDLADEVIEMAVSENGAASFTGKSKQEIKQVLQELQPTQQELTRIVPKLVREMDDFALMNAGSRLAASLSGRIAALRKAAKASAEEEVDFEEAQLIIDENISRKHAKEKAERAKQRAQEEYEKLHEDELFGPPAPRLAHQDEVGVH